MKKIIFLTLLFIGSLYAQEGLYAIKGGLLSHSTGPISNGQEEGIDLNTEVLWNKKFLGAYPYSHLGIVTTVNQGNDNMGIRLAYYF